MRRSATAALYVLWLLAGGSVCQAGVQGHRPDLSGIWWAVESFTWPDGCHETWAYVVAISVDGDRVTVSDGDGMTLSGTLSGGGVLRGTYPWSDGTAGHYTLELQVRDEISLTASGTCLHTDGTGNPVPQAPALVRFLFTRLGEPELREEGANVSADAAARAPLTGAGARG